jgi:hypothetical protein
MKQEADHMHKNLINKSSNRTHRLSSQFIPHNIIHN